jgi:hypothetical protein
MQITLSPEHQSHYMTELLSRKRRGIYWSAILGGAIAATAVSLVLITIGVGFGFGSLSPWYAMGPSAKTLTLMAAIWMMVVQWLASALGGYLTGRLRNRWHGFHADEGYFRDTVHGFLTWSVATILVAIIVSLIATGAMHAGPGGPPFAAMPEQHMVLSQITHDAAIDGGMPQQRLGTMNARTPDEVDKNISRFALFTGLAMMVGAFVASAAGAIGGIHRDSYDAKL